MVLHREASVHVCRECQFWGARCRGCIIYGVAVGAASRACTEWFRPSVEPALRLFEVEPLTVVRERVSR